MSWTPEALAVFERACGRHGGWHTWQKLQRITLRMQDLSGFLPRLKGLNRTFPVPRFAEILPHEQQTIFREYPDREHIGIFDRGAVRLHQAADGRIVAESPQHRETFRGLAKLRGWSPLDALYFFGYALWHYHTLPFTLSAGRLLSHQRLLHGGGSQTDMFRVELPAHIHTHCRVQTFYFDTSGLLVRHDYITEIVGTWAHGAHYWEDFRTLSGIPIALRRRVVGRIGERPVPINVLRVTLIDPHVDLRGA